MNFSDELIKIFDDLGKRLGIAIDWTASNVLPYLTDICKRVVTLEIIEYSLSLFVCILLLIVGIVGLRYMISYYFKYKNSGEDNTLYRKPTSWYQDTPFTVLGGITLVVSIVLTLVSFIIIPCIIPELIECIVLPEFTVIKFIKSINL